MRRRIASRRLPIAAQLPLPDQTDSWGPSRLSELSPIALDIVAANHYAFSRYLSRYHYLGYRGAVGESLAYIARDRQGRDLACVLFGAAAWKIKPRDVWIGWDDTARVRNYTTSRFPVPLARKAFWAYSRSHAAVGLF